MSLSDGPVLEMGMGLYSTPLLDLMCRQEKRRLVSYDNNPLWFKENEIWKSDFHELYFVTDWDQADIEHTHWSVALIDHKPSARRKDDVRRIMNNADYILIHDSEPEANPFFRYTWIYRFFKYRYDYTKCKPHTTVLSNFIDVTKL